MIRRPPSFTRTATLFPYTTLVRAVLLDGAIVIPDALRIDGHRRAQLAAVETAGLVDADSLQAEFLDARLQIIAQADAALVLAAAALMAGRPLVHAAENMAAEKGGRIAPRLVFRLLGRRSLFHGLGHAYGFPSFLDRKSTRLNSSH